MHSTWLTLTDVKIHANNYNVLKEGAAASVMLLSQNVGYCWLLWTRTEVLHIHFFFIAGLDSPPR